MATWAVLLNDATYVLAEAGVPSPRVDAKELAEFLCGHKPNPRSLADECTTADYLSLVGRRCGREPLQHITGRMYFRYLELACTPDVFIVRPETELVAGAAIDTARELMRQRLRSTDNERGQGGGVRAGFGAHGVAVSAGAEGHGDIACVAERGQGGGVRAISKEQYSAVLRTTEQGSPSLTVVDLCTGSGAIALSVATEVPGTRVYAAEISPQAFRVAERNNERYGNRVHIINEDALHAFPELEGAVDIVVTNPPYVPPGIKHSPEVQRDPQLALWGGGEDGLDLPRQLVCRATQLLHPGGMLIMEHAETQGEALRNFMNTHGFCDAVTHEDYTRRPRWTQARKI